VSYERCTPVVRLAVDTPVSTTAEEPQWLQCQADGSNAKPMAPTCAESSGQGAWVWTAPHWYLAHKKQHPTLGLSWGPRHSPTVGSLGGAQFLMGEVPLQGRDGAARDLPPPPPSAIERCVRGTSTIRTPTPPQDHHMSLCIGLR